MTKEQDGGVSVEKNLPGCVLEPEMVNVVKSTDGERVLRLRTRYQPKVMSINPGVNIVILTSYTGGLMG